MSFPAPETGSPWRGALITTTLLYKDYGKMEKGYALFLVKPTRNLNIVDEFKEFLRKRGYTILDETSKQLTPKQVIDNFFGILQVNIDYLTYGDVHAFWCTVEAEDVSEDVYETKMLFREKHGIRKMQLDNLVHSSDDGLEMMLQKQTFFPCYASGEYARGCDMYMEVNSFDHAIEVEGLLGKGMESICVLVESQKDQEILEKLSDRYKVSIIKRQAYRFCDQKVGYLLHYYKNTVDSNDISASHKIVIDYPKITIEKQRWKQWSKLQDYALFYGEVRKFYFKHFDKYQKELEKSGIQVDGVLIEQGNDCLLESNCRYFYAAANDLAMSAGSGGKNYIGQYYMPHSFEVDFWKRKV